MDLLTKLELIVQIESFCVAQAAQFTGCDKWDLLLGAEVLWVF